MTPEDKQLLLKDLSARLPYGVDVALSDGTYGMVYKVNILPSGTWIGIYFNRDDFREESIEKVKPYLRPMSSMTEEELSEYRGTCRYWNIRGTVIYENKDSSFDWLNAHHFDYRGLIPMELALEAPEGMYKTE